MDSVYERLHFRLTFLHQHYPAVSFTRNEPEVDKGCKWENLFALRNLGSKKHKTLGFFQYPASLEL